MKLLQTFRSLGSPLMRSLLVAIVTVLATVLVSWALNPPTGNPPTGTGNALYVATGTPANTIYVNTSGYVGISTTTPGYALDVNGSVRAVAFLYLSDQRLKQNIQPLAGDVAQKILSLRPVSFNWTGSGRRDTGLIAQEVEQLFPEYVQTDSSGIKSIDYARLVVPLIFTVQQQQQQLQVLQNQCLK